MTPKTYENIINFLNQKSMERELKKIIHIYQEDSTVKCLLEVMDATISR